MRTHDSRRRKHLVKKLANLVFLEQPVHRVSLIKFLRSASRRPMASRGYPLRNLKLRRPPAPLAAESRIEETAGGRFFTADSVGLRETRLTQSSERGPEQNRPESPPAVLVKNTRTG